MPYTRQSKCTRLVRIPSDFFPLDAPTTEAKTHIMGYRVKMNHGLSLSILFGVFCLSSVHMQLTWPPALRSKYNPYTTDIDYDMTSPLRDWAATIPVEDFSRCLPPEAKAVAN